MDRINRLPAAALPNVARTDYGNDRRQVDAGAQRQILPHGRANAIFSEATTGLERLLNGGQSQLRHERLMTQPLTEFQEMWSLAEEVKDHINEISKVATSLPSHIYSEIARDEHGEIIEPDEEGNIAYKNEAGEQTHRFLVANQLNETLGQVRDTAIESTKRQQEAMAKNGEYMTDFEFRASVYRHADDEVLRLTEKLGPDQLPMNCSERSMRGFVMLALKENNPQLDVVQLAHTESVAAYAAVTKEFVALPDGPEHALLLINRDPESDIANHKTWGENTIVYDGLTQRIYDASSFEEEMELLSSMTNGQTRCDLHISWPANSPYDRDRFYYESEGIGTATPRDEMYEKFTRTAL